MQSNIAKIDQVLLPTRLLAVYHELFSFNRLDKDWKDFTDYELWKEMCFCILSANVTYEMASSATEKLSQKLLLDPNWLIKSPISELILKRELSLPQFLPKRKNGNNRKYRYAGRSKEICNAARMIYNCDSLKKLISQFKTSSSLRKYLYDQIPGLGIKEASHFLRNIRFSKDIAIIDVHVLSFLIKMDLVEYKQQTLSHKKYLQLEQIVNDLSSYFGLDLSIFDLAIWHFMRSS